MRGTLAREVNRSRVLCDRHQKGPSGTDPLGTSVLCDDARPGSSSMEQPLKATV